MNELNKLNKGFHLYFDTVQKELLNLDMNYTNVSINLLKLTDEEKKENITKLLTYNRQFSGNEEDSLLGRFHQAENILDSIREIVEGQSQYQEVDPATVKSIQYMTDLVDLAKERIGYWSRILPIATRNLFEMIDDNLYEFADFLDYAESNFDAERLEFHKKKKEVC